MAGWHHIRAEVFPGVIKEEQAHGAFISGSWESLLKSGFARKEWLPGDEPYGNKGKFKRTKKVNFQDFEISCTEGRRRYRVYITLTGERGSQRLKLWELKEKSEREPRTEAEYRQSCAALAKRALAALLREFSKDGSCDTFSLADSSLRDVVVKAGELVDLVEHSTIQSHHPPRDLRDIEAALAAQTDIRFQSVLQNLFPVTAQPAEDRE